MKIKITTRNEYLNKLMGYQSFVSCHRRVGNTEVQVSEESDNKGIYNIDINSSESIYIPVPIVFVFEEEEIGDSITVEYSEFKDDKEKELVTEMIYDQVKNHHDFETIKSITVTSCSDTIVIKFMENSGTYPVFILTKNYKEI